MAFVSMARAVLDTVYAAWAGAAVNDSMEQTLTIEPAPPERHAAGREVPAQPEGGPDVDVHRVGPVRHGVFEDRRPAQDAGRVDQHVRVGRAQGQRGDLVVSDVAGHGLDLRLALVQVAKAGLVAVHGDDAGPAGGQAGDHRGAYAGPGPGHDRPLAGEAGGGSRRHGRRYPPST